MSGLKKVIKSPIRAATKTKEGLQYMWAYPTFTLGQKVQATAGAGLAAVGFAAGVLSVEDQHFATQAGYDGSKANYTKTVCMPKKQAVAEGREWVVSVEGNKLKACKKPGEVRAATQVETTSGPEEEFRSLDGLDRERHLWDDRRTTPGAWIWFVMGAVGLTQLLIPLGQEGFDVRQVRRMRKLVGDTLGEDEHSSGLMETLLKNQSGFDADAIVKMLKKVCEDHRKEGVEINDAALNNLCELLQSREFGDIVLLAARADQANKERPTTKNLEKALTYDHQLVEILHHRVKVDGPIIKNKPVDLFELI